MHVIVKPPPAGERRLCDFSSQWLILPSVVTHLSSHSKTHLELNCIVLGDDSSRALMVTIANSKNVSAPERGKARKHFS
jgi:hypothetical protein